MISTLYFIDRWAENPHGSGLVNERINLIVFSFQIRFMDQTKFPDKFWIKLNIIYLIYQYNIKKQLYDIIFTIRGKN